MRYYADLHIHSKYSRACSKDCDIEHLTWWARRKGITLVGTGDFTHPAWFAHLREVLEPAEPGLFRLRSDRELGWDVPGGGTVRFLLSVEIATIYKYGDRTRKVHHLCYMPDFAAAEEFNRRLGRIGNLGSDGRPILGLDSRDLLEITLESGEGAYLVPAHIWTPWFAVLGSKAGFDSVEECYRDLAGHIFALETGLSSDPAMNWRVSMLDRYTLVSHSDAHSPPMLGREASVFDTELDFFAVRRALETGRGFDGTVEFFPEEGKYHLDGHRKCAVRMAPTDTRKHSGQCPSCGKPLTVGVSHRVDALADRPEGVRPANVAGYRNLIPLPEIVGEVLGVGPKSKKVFRRIDELTAAHGPELAILEDVPLDELRRTWTPLAEAIERLRQGSVIRDPGYDGEYGTIRLFEPAELRRVRQPNAPGLFDDTALVDTTRTVSPPLPATPAARCSIDDTVAEDDLPAAPGEAAPSGVLAGLDADQRDAARIVDGPLLIMAGPGTGKTRTVTHRMAHLVLEREVPPGQCLAITFTRRAAQEMTERLQALLGAPAAEITVATFHSLGLRLLRQHHDLLDLPAEFDLADAARQHEILTRVTGGAREARAARRALSRDPDPDLLRRYTTALRAEGLVDFDELLHLSVTLLESDSAVLEDYRRRFRWITVDEYQDVDDVQYRLLRLLAPERANLTVIGDPDQAIYSFRGADVGFFLRFERDYPDAPVVHLTRNYRSGAHIVNGAVRAIRPATLVTDRRLSPVADREAHRIALHEAADERSEAAFVARRIDELLGGSSFHSLDSGWVPGDGHGGIGFSDVAVLYRTDAQSRAVLDELAHRGFPVQKRSHDPLSARPGVDHLMRELTHVSAAEGTVADRVQDAVTATLAALPDGDDHAAEIHAAGELLAPLARRCGDDLARFHREVLLGAEVDALDPRADAVALLTLHAAKGLEFPVVFVVGCEDGLIPLRWSGTSPTDAEVAEERRLLFVGMTRAQDHLLLTRSRRRVRNGHGQDTRRCPFLAELGDTVVEDTAAPSPRRQARQLSLL